MKIEVEVECKDAGQRPGCLREPDPKYTMSFEDIGEGCIYWCSHCGPEAHKMNEAIMAAFSRDGNEFADKLKTEIEKAESRKAKRN